MLVALAAAAPAGFVVAGDRTSPYIVTFRSDAVTRSIERKSFYVTSATTDTSTDKELDADKVRARASNLQARLRIRMKDVYDAALGGFSADLTAAQVAALESDPQVESVVPDELLTFDEVTASTPDEAGSGIRTVSFLRARVPAGVQRVGAHRNVLAAVDGRDNRVDADVAVLDTGIDRSHPDLNVAGGYNCTGRSRDKWGDADGHGTHVAGTVGALDNNIGVVGVAPGARLWSVKVLNSRGKGMRSWLVCGIDWVTKQRDRNDPSRPLFEVANMSISYRSGGSQCGKNSRDAVHEAICRSVGRGTVYVVAAGNESHNARLNHPASYNEVITVSAMADYDGRSGGNGRPSDSCPYWAPEKDDAFASFSNYGADVDLIAPGRCVLSTSTRKRYAWMSGTSMATPHVSGAVAVYRAMYPSATPHQVKLALQAVGTRDWRTSSDPDRTHEKAVWIGAFRTMPDFSVTATTNAQVSAGASVDVAVNTTRVGGFTDPISVDLVNLPIGLSATGVTTVEDTAILQLEASADATPGWYYLTLRSTSGDISHEAVIALLVPEFTHGPTLGS